MPPAIVAVAAMAAGYGAAAALTAAGAGIIIAAIGAGVASMGVSMIGNALIGQNNYDQSTPDLSSYEKGILLNQVSNNAPIPVIYGSRRVGGIRIFADSTGDSHEYLHIVLALCEGPISAINTVYLNDVPSTDAKFSGYVNVYKHLGDDDQESDNNLMSACSGWTSMHRLRGVAYLYVRLKYDKDVFASGLPTITADIDGKLVYDTRDATIKFSNNPSLCTRDYISNTRYGRGIPVAMLPDSYYSAAANYCDENVTVGGVTQKRYTCDGVINVDDSALSNTQKLLSSCRGMLVFSGGLYQLIIDKPESATFDFNEDNITGSWTISLGTKKNMFNRMSANFYNPDRSWQEDIAPVDSPALRALDNGLLLETKIDLPFTADINTAKQITTINLNQSRQQIVCKFTAFIKGLRCEVGKVVTITHSTPGWTAKKFRILNMALKNNDEVAVIAREYADTVYDFGTIAVSDTAPNTNLPDLSTTAQPISLETSEELYYTGKDYLSRVTFQWVRPEDIFIDTYDVEYKLSTAIDWTRVTTTKALSQLIDNLAPGLYSFRVRAVNQIGVSSAWSTINSYVFGKTAPPANISELWANASIGGLILTWLPVADIDLDYYILRWTPETVTPLWENSIDIGESKTTTLTIPAAKIGTYMVKAVDTTGHESLNAKKLTVSSVAQILNWNVKATLDEDPAWAGTKTNMIVLNGMLYLDIGGSWDAISDFDAVACIDTVGAGSSTIGYYETASTDLGTVQTVRCSGEAKYLGIDEENLFDSIIDFDAITGFDGNTNEVGLQLQIALSQDNVVWGSWQNFIIGDYTARSTKFQLKAYSNKETQYVRVDDLTFQITMPERSEQGKDVSVSASGLNITFATPYIIDNPIVRIVIQSAQAGDVIRLTNITKTGFTVQILGSGGSGVARTIDWYATGY